jgi:heptose-I-phosphate ethanolaminephosphotransferase
MKRFVRREEASSVGSWVALLVLNGFLLSPIPLYELLVPRVTFDRSLFFIVPVSLLWVGALHSCVRRPAVLHSVLLPVYLTVGADIFLIVEYHVRLSAGTFIVALDNLDSATAFLSVHRGAWLATALGGAAYVAALLQLRRLNFRRARSRAAIWVGALCLAYAAMGFRLVRTFHLMGSDLLARDQSSPMGAVSQAGYAYLIYRETIADERAASYFRFNAHRGDNPAKRRVVVLVIGESARPDHFQLYGYARDTTPELSRRGDLVVYRDVTSQAPVTKSAVPLMLTRGDIDTPERSGREKSIVSAYREAGYRTAWLSTQAPDLWMGRINRYTRESSDEETFEGQLDAAPVGRFAEILASSRAANESLFVVLHTQGSHMVYSRRYTRDFARFPADGVSDEDALVNTYDNSVLYTDHVLASIIDLLANDGAVAAMVYVGDHGENLRDDRQGLVGHGYGNERDIPVPMIFWMSPAYDAAETERASCARAHEDARVNSAAMFYTLADMGSVTIDDDSGFQSRSLLRATYVEHPRHFSRQDGRIVDFDATYPAHHGRAVSGDAVARRP